MESGTRREKRKSETREKRRAQRERLANARRQGDVFPIDEGIFYVGAVVNPHSNSLKLHSVSPRVGCIFDGLSWWLQFRRIGAMADYYLLSVPAFVLPET